MNYIVSEEELWDLLKLYQTNMDVPISQHIKGKTETIKDFIKSKQPVEMIASGEVIDLIVNKKLSELLSGLYLYKQIKIYIEGVNK